MSLPASQFYAVITGGRLECPQCGALILIGRGQPHQKQYDSLTGVLRCHHCNRAYHLGIIAWAAGKGVSTLPPDQKPTLRQSAELRQYARGFWAREAQQRADPVNRYIDGECCCYPLPWRPECPVHAEITQSGEVIRKGGNLPNGESPEDED
jgi:hypothetical protein